MKSVNIKIIFLALATAFFFACNNNSASGGSEKPAEPVISPKISLPDVSANNCLSIEKIMAHLGNPAFTYPASIMHSNLRPISEMSSSKTTYFSYTNFYYKTALINELNVLNSVKQDECHSIQLLTASREILNFKVTEHSANHVKFELTESFNEEMPTERREAFGSRIQPYEYNITYLNENSLRIVAKFRTVDALCDSKNTLRFEVTKTLAWAENANELPQSYDVDATYLALVKSALLVAPPSMIEELVPATVVKVSLDDINAMMATPIRDEFKFCR